MLSVSPACRRFAPLVVLIMLMSLFVPVSSVSANDRNEPPRGDKTDVPKSNNVERALPEGKKKADDKKKDVPETSGDVAAALAWSVSLRTTHTAAYVNQTFTLTATANQDVGPTPYYIQIYLGTTRYASCGFGTTCSVNLSGPQAGANYTFQARIADYYGNTVQAWSNTVTVSIISSGWSLSLTSTLTTANVGQTFTLTARANQDVGPTPYYIQIYLGTTRYASCGFGTTCSVNLSGPQAGAIYTFQARIATYDGANIQTLSNQVTVRIQLPSSVRLNVPFLTQIGTAGVANSGSNNCGPASVAMSINFFGNSVTVQDAAIAIRGSNNANNGTTDFKSTATANYLARYNLRLTGVSTFDDMRRELALAHPVIILVSNHTYRSHTPRPYESDSSGWFTNAHIIVVTGYDATNIYVNDPLRRVSSTLTNPANYAIPINIFKSAASNTPYSNSTSWYANGVTR